MRRLAIGGWAVLALLLFAMVPAFAFGIESGNDDSLGHARSIAISNDMVAPVVQLHSFASKTAAHSADYVDYVKFTAVRGSTYQIQVYGTGTGYVNQFRVTVYYYSNHRWLVLHGHNYVGIVGAFTNCINEFKADDTKSKTITYAVKIQPYNTKRLPGNYYVAVTKGSSAVKPDVYDAADSAAAAATPLLMQPFDGHRLFLDDVYTYGFLNKLQLHAITPGDVDFYRVEVPAGYNPQVEVFTGLYREYPVAIGVYDSNTVPTDITDSSNLLDAQFGSSFDTFLQPPKSGFTTCYFSVSSTAGFSFWYRVGVIYDSSWMP